MLAKSIKGISPEEIKISLQHNMADGFRPTLAMVFVSIKNDVDAVCRLLDQNGIQVFGATSSGEFIDGEISHGGIAILLMDMNPAHFKILLHDYRDKDPEAVARQMAVEAKEKFKNPSFIISVSIHALEETELFLGEPLIRAIESVTGKETIIWGGRAGDDFAFNETVVFTNQLTTKEVSSCWSWMAIKFLQEAWLPQDKSRWEQKRSSRKLLVTRFMKLTISPQLKWC